MAEFDTSPKSYSPAELTSVEKTNWINEMGVATEAAVVTAQSAADSAQSTATSAQSTADSAQSTATSAETAANAATTAADAATTTADAALLATGEAVKITGDQTVAGVKTFSSFATYTAIPSTPTGRQIPRMNDVDSAINAAINIPTSAPTFSMGGFTINSSLWNVRTVNNKLKVHNVNLNVTNAGVQTDGHISTTIPYTSSEAFVGYGTYESSISGALRVKVFSVSNILEVSLLKAESGQGWEVETWDFNFSFFTFNEA